MWISFVQLLCENITLKTEQSGYLQKNLEKSKFKENGIFYYLSRFQLNKVFEYRWS